MSADCQLSDKGGDQREDQDRRGRSVLSLPLSQSEPGKPERATHQRERRRGAREQRLFRRSVAADGEEPVGAKRDRRPIDRRAGRSTLGRKIAKPSRSVSNGTG